MRFWTVFIAASLAWVGAGACHAQLLAPESWPSTDVPVADSSEAVVLPAEAVAIARDESGESPPLAVLRAKLCLVEGSSTAELRVGVTLAEGIHTYPMADVPGRATRIDVASVPWLEIAGPAQPVRLPDEAPDPAADSAGSYLGQIEFVIPLRVLALPSAPATLPCVRVNGLLCSSEGYCVPVQDAVVQSVVALPAPSPPTR